MPPSLKEQFNLWKTRIDVADAQMEEARAEGDKFRDYYEGTMPLELKNAFDVSVMVDFVYVDMKQAVPTLYAKNPKLFMHPENPQGEAVCEVFEHIINTKWKELKMVLTMREGIKNAKLDGICGFKTYFNYKKEYTPDDWSGRKKNDEVCTEVVPLSQLIRDPDAPSWSKSPWIAHKITAKIDNICNRFNITGPDREKITISKSTKDSADFKLAPEEMGDFQFGTYYEIEDREKRKIYYLVDGLDRWAQKPKNFPKDPDGDDSRLQTMWDFLTYNEIPGRCDPKSDYAFWKQHIDEVTIFRSMRLSKAAKGQSKIIVQGNRLTDDQKDQIRSSAENSAVELELNQNILPFPISPLDPNVAMAEQSARADIQLISKQAPRQSGGDKTATEVKAVEQAQMEVSTDARDQLDSVIESIAQKWIYLMQENYTASKFVRITGISTADFDTMKSRLDKVDKDMLQGSNENPFLKVNRNNLKGDVTVEIQAGSTMPDNDQSRMQNLTGFANIVKGLGLTQQIDPEEFMRELVNAFHMQDENILARKDAPMEESKILQSGLFFAPRMSDDHEQHLAIHEREKKGSDEEHIHMMIHRKFLVQQKKAEQIQQQMSMMRMQPQVGGQSFMGDMQGQVGPMQQPNMPGMLGQVMPQAGTAQPVG